MTHILVAVDLSPVSHVIARKARNIADLLQAQLSVVHVLEYRPIAYGGSEFAIPLDNEVIATLEQHAKTALKKLGAEINVPEQHQYLKIDSVKQAIINLAEKLKVSLLVIGSHGRHGAALLLGSAANAILHSAQCDVLAVRI